MPKINNHKDFIKGEICSTAGVVIDPDLAKEYSQEVINLAIQLKANNLDGVGGNRPKNQTEKPLSADDSSKYDKFFINTAKRILYKKFRANFDAVYQTRAMNCDITDSQWAAYSAEEIIAMEKNGNVIPDEVIEWAHSQQQSDITNYVITIDSDSEDETIANTFTDTDSLGVLQSTAKKNIQKVEKEKEKINDKKSKYQTVLENAQQLKQDKEKSFLKSVEETKDLAEEFEELKSKKEANNLTPTEQQRYNKLSKQLKISQNEIKNSLSTGDSELDEFLNELDEFNTEIETSTQIAKDAQDAGVALNDIDKSYYSAKLPYAYTGTTLDNSGLISLSVNGLTNEEIGEIAIQKSTELNAEVLSVDNDINNSDSVEVVDFAMNYTAAVQESEDKSQQIAETENDESPIEQATNDDAVENTDNTEELKAAEDVNKDKKQLEYGVESSKKAISKTYSATKSDLSDGKKVTSNDKALSKELKTAKKKIDVINKQIENVNERLNENTNDTESFINELESLQADSSENGDINISNIATEEENNNITTAQDINSGNETEGTITKDENSELSQAIDNGNTVINAFNAADSIKKQEQNAQQETNGEMTVEKAAEMQKKAETREKKLEIVDKIQNLGADKQEITAELQKAINDNDNATKKSIELLDNLDKNNAVLEKTNEKTHQEANDAVEIGTGTIAIGTGHTTTGFAMYNYGLALMSNPFTFNAGVIQATLGGLILSQGQREILYGLAATGIGFAGKEAVSEENSVINSAISSMTEAQSVLGVKVASLDKANKNNTDTQQNAQQNVQTTENKEENQGNVSGMAAPVENSEVQENTLAQDLADFDNTELYMNAENPSLLASAINENIIPENFQQNQNTMSIDQAEIQTETAKAQEVSQPTDNVQPEANFEKDTNNEVENDKTSNKEFSNDKIETGNETEQATDELQNISSQNENNPNAEEATQEQSANSTDNATTANQTKTATDEQQNQAVEAKNGNETKADNAKDKKDVTEENAETATKQAEKYEKEMKSSDNEQKQDQKEVKNISKEIKDINKSTKKDEAKLKKKMATGQKQLEKKKQELEKKNSELAEKQAEQTETNAELAAIAEFMATAPASKQQELQTQYQSKSAKVVNRNAEIAKLQQDVSTIVSYGTKKSQTLNRQIKTYIAGAKINSKISQKSDKTAEKILKIADTTSQIAGLASIAGNITSRIGNSLTSAGILQINFWTPFLSSPFTVAAATAGIATATSTQVIPGTTTSIVGESVSLAANITNAAANVTKAAIFAEQGNIAGAIMSTGAAIMSGVSAGQNIQQIGQLNQMADAASNVNTVAQEASKQAEDVAKQAGEMVENGTIDSAAKEAADKAIENAKKGIATSVSDIQADPNLMAQTAEIQANMTEVLNGSVIVTPAGNSITTGFNQVSQNFTNATKFGLNDVLQIGGALQTVGGMIGSDNDGAADARKERKLKRFGNVSRIDAKRRTRKVNAVGSTYTNSHNSNNNSNR